jgi:phosphohistidine phosphatase
MKQLTIIRHAQARSGGMDFERPLNLRGQQDADCMAKRMQADGLSADIMLSSPAVRAASTAKTFAKHLGNTELPIEWHDTLYNATRQEIMNLMRELDSEHNHAVIVGHNPALTEISLFLQNDTIGYMPTCSVITIQFFDKKWKDITPHTGTLLRYATV